MSDNRDAMNVVRAELCDRLERLRSLAARASAGEFEQRVEGIRLLAGAYGLNPVARLADALQRGGARSAPSPERLRDATRGRRARCAARPPARGRGGAGERQERSITSGCATRSAASARTRPRRKRCW